MHHYRSKCLAPSIEMLALPEANISLCLDHQTNKDENGKPRNDRVGDPIFGTEDYDVSFRGASLIAWPKA